MHWGTWEPPHMSPVSPQRRPWVHSWRCPAVVDSSPSALSFFDSHQPRAEPPSCTTQKESRAEVQGTQCLCRARQALGWQCSLPQGCWLQKFLPCQSSSPMGEVAAQVARPVPSLGPRAKPPQGDHASLVSPGDQGIFMAVPLRYPVHLLCDPVVHLPRT